MGIQVVSPVIVNISQDFVDLLQDHTAWKYANKSLGYNFGSEYVKRYSTILPAQDLGNRLLPYAQTIFAFDVTIQNPDRTNEKPNMLNSKYLIKSIKTIQEGLGNYSDRLKSELRFNQVASVEEITKATLPKDDSALVFSEVKKALDISVDAAVADLFPRMVGIHLMDEEVRRDKEVWTKIYKKHFDEYGISSHLSAHKVKTKHDELEFDKAWKNGAWNCFESVSFNLTRPDAIKNKVYKWVGKLDELSSAREPMHIYLLSVLPSENSELDKFITKKIKEKATDNIKIDLISENDVDRIAKRIKKEIESHG